MGLLGEALRKPAPLEVQPDSGHGRLRRELQRQGLSTEAIHTLEAFEQERNRSGTPSDWLEAALRTYRRIDWVFQISQRIEHAPQKPTATEAKELITAAIAVYVGIVSGR